MLPVIPCCSERAKDAPFASRVCLRHPLGELGSQNFRLWEMPVYKTRHSAEVPVCTFWGLNDVPNCRVPNPKNEILSWLIEFLRRERQIQILITWILPALKPIVTNYFFLQKIDVRHHEWVFVGRSTTSLNKSNPRWRKVIVLHFVKC